MSNEKHSYETIYKILPALLILLTIYTATATETAFAVNSSGLRVETISQDDFDKKFREARDLIDGEEWARAAEKFREVIEKYPNGKSADAALYWLAFCHKKQKQFEQTDAALNRLLEKFPASSWATDARVMKLEIVVPLGRTYSSRVPPATPALTQIYSGVPLANTVEGNKPASAPTDYLRSLANGAVYTSAAPVPLDRADEIKIAAFQSLLAADAKRAIETMGEMLKPDSKASESLKREALRVLRTPRILSSQSAANFISSGAGKEFAPLLRETLVKSFQNETNLKIRKDIIYALANLGGEQSAVYLTNLYNSESDREIKRAIINSFGAPANVFHGFNSSAAPKRTIEPGVLLEIVGSEKDAELRRLAFSNLRHFPGWADGEQTIEKLANVYDSESDEAFKISIINAFSGVKQNRATRKLLDIARNDKSDKLRLEAIYSLRTSKNPEVLKFLEELIK